jgi:hypothetical protein
MAKSDQTCTSTTEHCPSRQGETEEAGDVTNQTARSTKENQRRMSEETTKQQENEEKQAREKSKPNQQPQQEPKDG